MSNFYRGKGRPINPDQENMSNLECEVLIALHNAYRSKRLKEPPLSHEPIGLNLTDNKQEITITDYYFHNARLAVYLDGPHHLNPVHSRRDHTITEKLREEDVHVLRIQTTPKTKVHHVTNQIREKVNQLLPNRHCCNCGSWTWQNPCPNCNYREPDMKIITM